jgi:CHAT domain-containing protein
MVRRLSGWGAALMAWPLTLVLFSAPRLPAIAQSPKTEATRLFQQGNDQFAASDFSAAFQSWQQALKLFRATQDRRGESAALGNLGIAYKALGNYAQAIEYQEQSLAIDRALKNRRGEGDALGNLGNVYQLLGNYAKAIEYQEQSLAIARELNDRQSEGASLGNLGLAYESLANYPKAIAYQEQRLAITRVIKDRLGESQALGNLGNVYTFTGNYEKAIEYQLQSLAITRELKDRLGEAQSLNNLGLAHKAMGNYSQAIAYYEQSLAIARILKDPNNLGIAIGNLGNIYYFLGNYAKAIEYQNLSLKLKRIIRDRQGEAVSLGDLGVIYEALGDAKKAIDYYQQRLTITRDLKDRHGESEALGNLGNAHLRLKDYEQAIAYHQQSLTIIRAINDRSGEGASLANLGIVYGTMGNHNQAIAYHQKSLAIKREVKDRLGAGQILSNLGFSLLTVDKLPEAETALRSAITIWASLRTGLTDQNKVSLAETQVKSYQLLQRVLVRQNRSEAALEIAEKGRARAFAELLAARLRDKSMAEIQTIAQAPNLAEIRRIAKTQNATLVEYALIGKAELYVWVIKPSGEITFHASQLNATLPIQQLVAKSRSAIGVRGRGEKSTQPANGSSELARLYQVLVEPIGADLPRDPNQRVIFLPQGALFLVPFPALPDAQGKYLIEKHTITTAPSIQTLALTHAKNKLAPASRHAVVVGDPTMPRWQDEQLPALPGARQEAIAIAQILNTQPLIGDQATKKVVIQQMQQATIVHLATHGLLNTSKGDVPGAIALAPSGQDSGLLTASEIFDLKLNADLVVLSACDTGRGDITGDGVIGLSRSLVAAGVPSVIVSLWAVNDSSTSVLMSEFYRQLNTKPDKAQALRQAMLTTLKQYPNPSDWAAFTLIGEAE